MARRTPSARSCGAVAVFTLAVAVGCAEAPASASASASTADAQIARGPLEHDAYLWQRRWSADVDAGLRAVEARGTSQTGENGETSQTGEIAEIMVLAAEVDTRPPYRVATIDWRADWLARTGRPVGLVIRVGPWSGPFAEPADPIAALLIEAVTTAIARAEAAGLAVAEIQIDFDAGSAQLGGYGRWLAALREHTDGYPLTITALPDWLDQPALPGLLDRVDGWVLQVHGLDPAGSDVLIDPEAAASAVLRAGALARPFRVALPTYTYLQTRDQVAAEQAPPRPSLERFRRVDSEPRTIAQLVAGWQRARPAAMTGIAWFRLPTAGDRFAWSWTTFDAVRLGDVATLEPDLALCSRGDPSPLVELGIVNRGAVDAWPEPLDVRWSGTRVASDALAGFALDDIDDALGVATLRPTAHRKLVPGEVQAVGWLRGPELTTELERCR